MIFGSISSPTQPRINPYEMGRNLDFWANLCNICIVDQLPYRHFRFFRIGLHPLKNGIIRAHCLMRYIRSSLKLKVSLHLKIIENFVDWMILFPLETHLRPVFFFRLFSISPLVFSFHFFRLNWNTYGPRRRRCRLEWSIG